MTSIPSLLSSAPDLQFDDFHVDEPGHQIVLALSSIQPTPTCPCCGFPSKHIHAHYDRTIADLPWADFTVRLQLAVRKFRCVNQRCPRQIFCERSPRS